LIESLLEFKNMLDRKINIKILAGWVEKRFQEILCRIPYETPSI
jgi:hypothetical protein